MERKSGEGFRGDIPALSVRGKGIAEAWENSVVELYNKGAWYAREGPKDKGRLHPHKQQHLRQRTRMSLGTQPSFFSPTAARTLCLAVVRR